MIYSREDIIHVIMKDFGRSYLAVDECLYYKYNGFVARVYLSEDWDGVSIALISIKNFRSLDPVTFRFDEYMDKDSIKPIIERIKKSISDCTVAKFNSSSVFSELYKDISGYCVLFT